MTEDEMVGWHHRLNGYEFEQAPGVGEGQGSLACCSPWGCKESDMTERLNNKKTTFDNFTKLLSLLLSYELKNKAGTKSENPSHTGSKTVN